MFLLILAFMPVQILEAKQIDASSALERALRNNGCRRAPSRIVGDGGDNFTLVPRINAASRAQEGGNVYVFNHGDDGGYIVVSGDDEFTPVLAYADSGSFDWSDIPTGMKYMLEMYEAEISAYRETILQISDNDSEFIDIEPLVNMKWSQKEPYNLKTPMVRNNLGSWNHALTGCVATAMAQVMQYHRWPEKEFDWKNMLPEYIEGAYTETQADAVATLMLACGEAVDTDYDLGSYANSDDLTKVFSETFNYEKSTIRMIHRDNLPLDSVSKILVKELREKRPVIVSGVTNLMVKYEFVLDGCNSDGYFHINWGWGGDYDGYFLISALAPYGTAVLASPSYNWYLRFLVGIQRALPNPGDYNEEDMEVVALGDIRYAVVRSDIFGMPSYEGWITENSMVMHDGFMNKLKNKEPLISGCKFVDKKNGKIFYEWSSDELHNWNLGAVTSVLHCDLPDSYTKMTGKDIPVPAGSYDVYPILKVKDSDRIIEVKAPLGMKQCIEMVIYEDKHAVIIDEPKMSDLTIAEISTPKVIHQSDEIITIGFKGCNGAGDYYLGDINIELKCLDSADKAKKIGSVMAEFTPGESRDLQFGMEIGVDYENGNYRFIFTDLRGKIIGESEVFALAGVDPTKMITVDETSFPDPVFRSWVQSHKFDDNNDGYFSEKERRRIKAIDLGSYGEITNLKGIELFPEIELLIASGNFTNLNLEPCPALYDIILLGRLENLTLGEQPNLEKLDLTGNSLKTLNLDNYPNLKEIYLGENKLETIKLGEMPGLSSLMLFKNNLKRLDLEKFPNIKRLDLDNNKLESLILGEKPLLEEIYVGDNSLEELDLRKCPELKKLRVSNNHLRTLKLGYKPYLKELDVFRQNLESVDLENCPALRHINLGENQLQSLDFGENPLLESLILYYNNLTALSLDNMPLLSDARLEGNKISRLVVKGCPALESLSAWNNEIENIEIIASPKISYLSLSDNKIKNIDLRGLPKLESLSLGSNLLKSLDVSANIKLKELYASSNMITNIDLSQNPDLSVFDYEGRIEVEAESDGSFDLNQLCQYGFDFNKFVPYDWCKNLLDETGTKIIRGSEFAYYYMHGSPNSDVIGDRMYMCLALTPKNPSGIDYVIDDRMTFAVSAGTVEFINKPADDVVNIYNISGQSIYRGCEATVSGLASGIYIAKVGGKAIKIFVP